ncbi:MAG: hypothetical protein RL685_6240 [Pseudomonadota bacterium]
MTVAAGIQGWIVLPAYEEARGVRTQLEALARTLVACPAHTDIRFTLLVVNDGSRDDTSGEIERARASIEATGVTLRERAFLRNFGHQAAIVAGLDAAAEVCDFAVTMDADGEHPHGLLPELIAAWRAGAPLVHTLRRPNRQLGAFKRTASASYYRLLSRISGVRIQPGMADFKLWDGELLRELRPFLPSCGSTRVFATWLAPSAPTVQYDQDVVAGRQSRFTLRKNLSLALAGLVRYSDAPLRLSLWMSTFAGVVAVGHSLFVLRAVYTGSVVPGWATIVIIVAFFGALQSFAIGMLGEYLLRISFRSSLPAFVTRPARTRRPRSEEDPHRT